MRATVLIDELQRRGIRIYLREGRLRCTAPPGAVTSEIRRALEAHNATIIAVLSQQNDRTNVQLAARVRCGLSVASFAQQRLLFLDRLSPGDTAYNISAALRLVGDVDFALVVSALNALVERHEVLRTRFVTRDGEAWQEISSDVAISPSFVNLESGPAVAREAEGRRLVAVEAARPFDLSEGPLLRLLVLDMGRKEETGAREHIVVFTMHHIVSDGWSTDILIREFTALYEAFASGRESPLAPLPLQYADYAAWQREWLKGEPMERQLAYWREKLSQCPSSLDLPSDHARPAVMDHAGAAHGFHVRADVVEGLRALCRREGATLFMGLLAGFYLLLSRYSGQKDVCVGTPVANRRRVELEGLIGFFVNTLALRTDLSGGPSFVSLLRRVRETALGAQAHQDLPFERLVEELRPVRDMSRSPLFQAMFVFQNAPSRELALPGLRIEALTTPSTTSKFDLTLSLAESADGLEGGFEYATTLFAASTIARMAESFQTLLEGIVADPQARIDALPVIGEAEHRHLVADLNATAAGYRDACLHELFAEQASRLPDAVAVRFDGRELTYGELNARSNRLAQRLRRLGVGAETVVGVCAERSLEMVVGLLGVLKAGGAYLPLDPDYPRERLDYMIGDACPLLILTQARLEDRFDAGVRRLRLDADWESIAREPAREPVTSARPGNLAYVIYTSGSTGRPKGVCVTHGGLANLTMAQKRLGAGPGSRVLQFSSASFDAAIWEAAMVFGSGACLIVPRRDQRAGEALRELLAAEKVTHATLPPAVLAGLAPPEGSALTCIVAAGEPLPAASTLAWAQRCRMIDAYGPTETTVCATMSDALVAGEAPPIGRPLPNTQVYLLDASLELCPLGACGELFVGGAGVARGYLGRADLTAERFLPDPFGAAGLRLYRTGDLCRYRTDGNLEFLGRRDDQVKIRGFRIELGEIEASLARIASVREAVVTACEDSAGEKRLVAYVTARDGATLISSDLRDALRSRLPDYMVPSIFVTLDALPLTQSGKIDRKALPAPDVATQARERYVAPRTPTEAALCAIWADVLGLEQVGVDDNFFELGGHSLLAVALADRMGEQGLFVDVRALFSAPTVAGAATALGERVAIDVPPNLIAPGCERITPDMLPLIDLTQAQIDAIASGVSGGMSNIADIYPLAPLQEGILFHHVLGERGDAYLLPMLISFERRDRLDATLCGLRAMIARHETLRTSAAWEGLAEPAQVVWRDAPLIVEELVLDARDGAVCEQLRERFDPRRYRLDLRRAPLMRGVIAWDAASERWLLMLLTHHFMFDHATLAILLAELRAHVDGEGEGLPPTAPFRDFIARTRSQASRSEQEAFFTRMLRDVSEPTFPFGLADVRGDGSGVAEAAADLDADLAARARACARSLGVSAASLFHQAFALVLSRICGRSDVVFGTVLSGRAQGGEGMSRTLGIFINTLPVRIRIDADGVASGVRRTHGLLLDLLRHESASLALAQRCSGVAAPTPLFSALLNYRHGPNGRAAQVSQGPQVSQTAGWDGVDVLHAQERTNYPFVLSVDDLGEGFRLTAQVEASLDPDRLCAFMREALAELVAAAESTPARAVCTLAVIPPAEHRRLVAELNATAAGYRDACLHELFAEQASRLPDGVAVRFDGRELTYGELNARSNRLAQRLRRLGVGAETVVGVCAERSLEMVVGLLGVLKAGGAYLPLDPDYPRERLDYMIADACPLLILTQARLEDRFDAGVRRLRLDADWESIAREPAREPANIAHPGNLAYVIYTSGSTGRPKGVCVTHGGLANLTMAQKRLGAGPGSRVLQFSSASFDAAIWEAATALSSGACLVVAQKEERAGAALMGVMIDEKITHTLLPPSILPTLTPTEDLALDCLVTGGEAVPADATLAWAQRCRMIDAYGPTETTVCATMSDALVAGEAPPIGRPLPNTQIYLLDGSLELCPLGACGELFVGGAGVARGYLGRADLTAERFLPDPFGAAGSRLYRTGDLCRYRPDGNLEFLGRRDDQVKIRGFRIELGEIEASLARIASVRESVVTAREDSAGEKRLVAYVTARDGATLVSSDLRDALRSRLPDYMVPSIFVTLDVLPLTQSGKIDRKALPAPDVATQARERYVAPRTVTEWILAKEFAAVLGREQIGVDDDFFELGGNSLSGMKLVERLRRTMCSTFPLSALFQAPTISALANWIATAEDQVRSSLVPMRRGAPIAPLYCIHPGGGSIIRYRPLADALSGARPVYGVQSRGLLDPTFVDRSIDEMATHYVDTIRQRQPEGPYFLIGWCLGGVIAMAMAALLEAQGEEIAFLGLVDFSTAVVSFPGEASILDYLDQLAAIEGVKLGAALTPDERTLLAQASEQRSARERLTYAAEWGREKGYWSDVSTELFERLFSDSENSLRMLQYLRLKRISSSIHVWWAEATLRALGGPPVDWAELTQGDAAIRLVPATHEDILTQAELHSEVDRAVDIAERALRLERSSTAENAYS